MMWEEYLKESARYREAYEQIDYEKEIARIKQELSEVTCTAPTGTLGP